MTRTLRRERIQNFIALIVDFIQNSPAIADVTGDELLLDAEIMKFANRLADAAASRTEVTGIEAAMFGDRPVTASDLPIGDEALKSFERDMQCPGSWSWYPAKSTDEPAWKSLREFVVSLYQSDPKAFEKYYTWAVQPYSRGAKSLGQIRFDPTCFEYAWQAYQAANPSAGKSISPDLPTYQPDDDSQFVPAPEKK